MLRETSVGKSHLFSYYLLVTKLFALIREKQNINLRGNISDQADISSGTLISIPRHSCVGINFRPVNIKLIL